MHMHIRTNYSSWNITHDDFFLLGSRRDEFLFLLKFAVLAPSPFNTQPWIFRLQGSSITLSPDFRRALTVADPGYRDLFISLGCALENLLVAAEFYGFHTDVEVSGSGEDTKISVEFQRLPQAKSLPRNHLIFSIPKRYTDRGAYRPEIPDRNFLGEISRLGFSSGISVSLLGGEEAKKKVADILIPAEAKLMENPDFRKEIARYMKPNTTHSPVGMPGHVIGIPTPVSFLTPLVAPFINFKKLMARKDHDTLVQHTPVLGLLSVREDEEADWISAGRVYERIALMGEHKSIHIAPYSISAYTPRKKESLGRIFGSSSHPVLAFRLGYGREKVHHTPRFSPEDILYPSP